MEKIRVDANHDKEGITLITGRPQSHWNIEHADFFPVFLLCRARMELQRLFVIILAVVMDGP